MILTVTMNVAIDKRYEVERLTPGEVMRVLDCRYTAGGKGLNVSRVAAIAGERVVATGIIGGYAGEYVREALSHQNVETDFVKAEGETRSCINIFDRATGTQTEFLEPGLTATDADAERFLEKYRALLKPCSIVTISGSVPRGIPKDFYAKLIADAKALGKPVLLDTSGELLLNGVKALPTLIKPNSDEARVLTHGNKSAEDAAVNLYENGIPYVAVSQGKDGVLVVCKEGMFRGLTPDIPVVNTVGSGDSMLAGFAVGLCRGFSIEETIRFAVAVSTANATHEETGFYRPEDLPPLLEQISVRKL